MTKGQLFVGRQRQLKGLESYLERTLAGQGQVCFVTGQAGSGKTALVRQFLVQALAAHPDLIVAAGRCNAQTGIGDPYLPFREALAMLTGDAGAERSGGTLAPENAQRLRTVLVRSVQVLVEVAPDLIGLFVPGVTLVGTVGKAVVEKAGWMDQLEELVKRKTGAGEPEAEQGRIFEQYTAFLQRLSTKTPLVVFVDDLQWADNASIGLLFQLGRQVEASRILILGCYRPNDVAMGRGGGRHPLDPIVHELARYKGDVHIDLDEISVATSRRFVDAVLDAEPNALGEEFRQALFHQTGGLALFTVELIRALQERGDLVRDAEGRWREGFSLDWDALPARVEGVVAERIARLSGELMQLLTVCSVEGEQFTAEVVARVQALNERQTVNWLSDGLQRQHRLVSAQGLVQLGHQRLSIYRFVHNLFQQYVYGSLDDVERACLHREMGQALEELFAGETEEVAAKLARHYEESGVPGKAALYRLQAGNRAQRMLAFEEAVTHLNRGLELVASLPPGAERMELELALQTSLGSTLVPMRGYASQEAARAFGRGRELCRALGDPPRVIPVLFGLCLFYMSCGDLTRAREEGERLLQLAREVGDIGYEIAAHFPLGVISFLEADLNGARAHYERAMALHDPVRDRDLARQHGQDPVVASQLFLSWLLWLQGYAEQALGRAQAALKLAEEINHPYTSTLAALLASDFYHLVGQWPECQAQAERGLMLANKWHFPFSHAGCTMHIGAAIARQGQLERGTNLLHQGVEAWKATGTRMALAYWDARLAEAYLLAGRREEGLASLDDSFRHSEEIWWRPEQYRVGAELLLLTPGNELDAETSLRKALALARDYGARALELRVVMSLARLLGGQGRGTEGHDLLAGVYGWFTEGLDTPDLRDARALLVQLEAEAGHP